MASPVSSAPTTPFAGSPTTVTPRSFASPRSSAPTTPRFNVASKVFRSPFPDVSPPLGFSTLPAAVLGMAHFAAETPALLDDAGAYTFAQLSALVDSAARGLAERGFGPGETLAVFLPNVKEFVLVLLAAHRAGGRVTVINPAVTPEEFTAMLRVAQARWVVTTQDALPAVYKTAKPASLQYAFVVGGAPEEEPASPRKKKAPVVPTEPFPALLTGGDGPAPPKANSPNDVALVLFTAGTGGEPRAVELTHRAICTHLQQAGTVDPAVDVHLVTLPLAHAYALCGAVLAGLRKGSAIVLTPPYGPVKRALELIEAYGVTHMTVVPPAVKALAQHPAVDQHVVSTLRSVAVVGARLSFADRAALLARWQRRGAGLAVKQHLAVTEAGPLLCFTPDQMDKPTSVGLLVPNTEAVVVDARTGARRGPGEEGEIWVRGPQLLTRYVGSDALDAEGWLRTGDVGSFDADGACFVTDRLAEMIPYKGYQVAPAEIEAVLLTVPGIAEAAVVGVPDEAVGARTKAFVARDPHAERVVSAEELRAAVAQRVAPYKKVHLVEFCDTEGIPKQRSGQPLRRELQARCTVPSGQRADVQVVVGAWRYTDGALPVKYCVELRLPNGECVSTWRRFREFRALNEKLEPRFRRPLPHRVLRGNLNPALLEERRSALQQYLVGLVGGGTELHDPHADPLRNPDLRLFLRVSLQQVDQARATRGAEVRKGERTGYLIDSAEGVVETVRAHTKEWAEMAVREKIQVLQELRGAVVAADWSGWTAETMAAEGLARATDESYGTELVHTKAVLLSQIDGYVETLGQLARKRDPRCKKLVEKDGNTRLLAYPRSVSERLGRKKGWEVEVRVKEGESVEFAGSHRMLHGGKLGVVLGGSDACYLPFVDVLQLLFAKNMVAVVKHSERRPYNQHIFESIFAGLIDRGFVGSVAGGASVGEVLAGHDHVDHVHVTGCAATYDAVLWGADPRTRAQRRAQRQPVLTKPLTAALGAAAPYVVAPADFTEAELRHHAKQLAMAFASKAAASSFAPKVLVISAAWRQRAEFLDLVRAELRETPLRPAACPGVHAHYAKCLAPYAAASVERIGVTAEVDDVLGPRLPWTLLHAGTDEALPEDHLAPILAVVQLQGPEPWRFLENATTFCNERVAGSTAATLILHPSLLQGSIAQALDELRYGVVGVNAWVGLCYGLASVPWGAFGESGGRGAVRNTLMVDNWEKTVVRAPFLPELSPGGKALTHARADAVAEYLTRGGKRARIKMAWTK